MKFLQILFLFSGLGSFAFGQVANDNCTSAQAITIPSSGNVCITSTTVNALSDNTTSTCDTGTPGNEVWFTFIATGSQNTVTVTPTGSPAIQQAVVAIDGTGCADNAFNICNGSTTNNGTATATWTFTPGTQVWISVESNNGTQGSFQLCVTSTTPPPSPGGSCATATPLCNLNNFTLSPFPPNNNGFTPNCFLDPLQQPVFYQFTVGQTGTLAWTADVQGTAEYDWALYNITGGCPANNTTPLACNYNFANGNSNIIGMQAGPGTCSGEYCDPVTVTAGQTYMLIIDNFSNNGTGFIMSFAGSTFLMAPTAQFTVNPTTACGSANVSITNTSVAASGYNWNFGNGNTSNLQNPPAQNYTTPGNYLISLTASSPAGCTNTTSQSVTVNANHTITAGANQTACINVPITNITMTLGGGATGATAGGLPPGVSSSVSAGVVTLSGAPTSAGTYNYTITTTGNSCTVATTTGTITVVSIPTPTITTVPPTCSASGSAAVTNYDGTLTYTFTPSGPTVGAGGAISGMTTGTNYTLIAGNGTCNSTASSSFTIAAQLATPAIPTITIVSPTCSAGGTASITNYDGTLSYVFTPTGPIVGAGGAISNMTAGTNYTVTAGNGSCTSAPSNSFSIAAQLTTPATPTITTVPATCSSNGTASITNYSATLTYTFTPSGPTVGAGGVISGMTVGTSYTVIAGNGSCSSAPSNSFSISAQLITPAVPTISVIAPTCSAPGSASISNYDGAVTYISTPSGITVGAGGATSGMTAGTTYTITAGNGSCTSTASSSFSIAAQLTTPAVPTITTTAATCSSNGTATITNYNVGLTYTFTPTGPTAGANGVISGMTVGTSYTVVAGNGSCSSAASSSFSIAAQLITPAVPTTSVVTPTCTSSGSASITNYDGTLTYTFSPSGPTVGAGGAISGMTPGTSYTVTAGNGSCTSAASGSFSIAAQLTTPATPTITTSPATCASNGTATITNYLASLTYTFTPAGPTAGANGVIAGMTIGTSYTVIAGNGSCSSIASSSFSIAAQLITPAVPTISVTSPTCSADGTASISNYDGTLIYTFSPAGPSVGIGGLISGMTVGSNYSVTAGNGSCTSASSVSFSIAPQLTTPPVPTIAATPATCSSNGTATITNYVSTQTYTFTPTGPTVGAVGLISGLTAGTSYTVTASTGPCTSAASSPFTIDAPIPFPSIPFQVDVPEGCSPHTATLSAVNVPGIQYQWTSNGSLIGNGASLTSVFTNPGCYDIQLTISDAQGCVATSSEPDFVCVEANPVAAFTPNPTLFTSNSQNVIFTNSSTGAETYVWDFGDMSTSTEANPVHFYTNIQGGMIITLTATSALGCTDEATYVINFLEETIFYVPNSFTPDQDEFNQTWGPVFTQGFDPYNFDLYIFNRWGELIWESHDASAQWDGTYGGKALHCPDGVYTWKINYKPKETDEKIVVVGSVRIIR